MHKDGYEKYKKTFTLESIQNIADGTELGLPVQQDQCQIVLSVYPSDEFYNVFTSQIPVIMTASVAGVFVFTVFMFIFYDRLVERRQALVMRRALQTTAIVSSLFPKQVQEKLLAQTNVDKKSDGNEKKGVFMAPNARVKGFLDGGSDGDEGAPIAELYPRCSVLFAGKCAALKVMGFLRVVCCRPLTFVFIS